MDGSGRGGTAGPDEEGNAKRRIYPWLELLGFGWTGRTYAGHSRRRSTLNWFGRCAEHPVLYGDCV